MKKIIALFVLMLGVSFTASAQKKAVAKPAQTKEQRAQAAEIQKGAQADTKALNEFVKLSDDQMVSFRGLFEYKYRNLAEGLSDERKKALAETIEMKINATLTPDQVTKLSQNPTLLNQLTGKK
ncbi:hypothetical protein [Flavobacterium akiainvivens]|nr:hypothetical protein [Flavobacterium akiainvivens]SFQ27949.1 hypothetical protein SAMN05444144_102337 [Flavobacterium akiainvivens]